MRSAYPGGFGYGQQSAAHNGYGAGAPSAGHNPETDRLSSLKRAIDSIEQRLHQAPQPVPPYAQPNFAQPHYGAGAPMAASYAPIVPPVAPAQQSELGLMQAQLNQLASQIGMPQAHDPIAHQGFNNSIPQNSPMGGANAAANGLGDIHSIAAQIARRQQALNAGASQPSSMSMQPNTAMTGMSAPNTMQSAHPAAASGDMGDIIKQLGELKNELSTIKQEVSKPAPEPKIVPPAAVPQEEIDRIASAIADLQSNQAPDEATFERLTAELDGLRQSMSQDMRSVVRNELDAEQPQSQSHLTERLDALAYGLNEISTQSANHVTPRVENLSNQLENLRVTIDDLPQTLAISRLEERLTDMTARLDSFANEMTSGPNAGPNDVDLTSIESRLDEVARALVAVSNAGRQAPEIDLSAVERVEARVTDLARTLDSVAAQSNTADELDNLAVRIDGLTERLGSFEKYAESGDLGGASAMFAAPDTGVIEDQLRALNNRVEQAAAQSQTQTLEDQIRALSARVEEAANINSTASQMSNLEAQIGQILRHLNKSDAGVAVDFSPVEARLGQIETQLMSNQNFSLEAAQQAAQQAVSLMGPQSESAQIIEALSNDLRNLQNVAEGGNSQNAATILEVQNTLQQVVQRLGSIEGAIEDAAAQPAYVPEPQPVPVAPAPVQPMADIPAAAAPMNEPQNLINERTDETVFAADGLMDAADSEEQLGVIHKAALDAGLIQDPSSAPIRVDAPSIDPNYTFDSADNRPLEPGVPTSDIDQMVKQASEQLNAVQSGLPNADGLNVTMPTPEPVEAAGESRPDAIAAARRALQATTAEMNAVRDEAAKEPKPSAVGGLKAKLESLIPNFDVSKLRKPLVMGAAALLLAIVAFKGVSMFSGGADKPVAEVDTPAIEMSANSGTKVDDATGDAAAETTAEAPKVVRSVGEGADDNQVASADSQSEGGGPTTLPDAGSDGSETETPVVTDEGQSETEPQVASVTDSDGAVESSTEVTTPSSTSTYDVPSAAGSAALVAAASAGEPKALYQLGMRYSDGTEVKRNMQESAKWFERSAETGFAPAQYSIGSLYEKGIGVERDVVKASQWYEKAAGQGNARAMHNLAVIQAMGNPPEVQPDMDKAVGWFQKAADLGIKDSQFNLGILYGQGMGVPQNLGTSYKWFALAAKTGDSDANKKRDEVANAMDPDDLDDARKEVNNWAPKKIDAEVNRVSVPAEWKGRGSASGQAAKTNGAESVKKAQMLLNQRGFSVGEPDGLMGPKTKKAIMEFQRGAGIPVNGKVDLKLLKALNLQT